MKSSKGKSPHFYFICAVVILLLANLWPQYGMPPFRYNGFNAQMDVWQLGWPTPLFILDFRQAGWIHMNSTTGMILAAQSVFLAIWAIFVRLYSDLTQ